MRQEDKKKDIYYISFLQFIGPIFVILGHSLNGMPFNNGIWWIFTKDWIYIFHMPLFFMISGYLLSYSGWMKGGRYGSFIKKKFLRLIVPYLFWNIICFIPKFIMQGYLVDSVEISPAYVIRIFLAPRQNIWGHTWFLVGLFLVYLLTPLWQKMFSVLKGKKVFCILAVGIVLYVLPIGTEFFCLSDLHKDVLFFWLGCLLGSLPYDRLYKVVKDHCILFGILSAATSLFALLCEESIIWHFIPCACILLFLLSCGMHLENWARESGKISMLARNSFGIYIMHWPVMLCCRVLFFQILGLNPVLTIFVMIVLGYLVPNVAVWIFRRVNNKGISTALKYLIGV